MTWRRKRIPRLGHGYGYGCGCGCGYGLVMVMMLGIWLRRRLGAHLHAFRRLFNLKRICPSSFCRPLLECMKLTVRHMFPLLSIPLCLSLSLLAWQEVSWHRKSGSTGVCQFYGMCYKQLVEVLLTASAAVSQQFPAKNLN